MSESAISGHLLEDTFTQNILRSTLNHDMSFAEVQMVSWIFLNQELAAIVEGQMFLNICGKGGGTTSSLRKYKVFTVYLKYISPINKWSSMYHFHWRILQPTIDNLYIHITKKSYLTE